MPIDPSVLLRAQGIRLPDPLALAQRQMLLSDLAGRRELQQYQLESAKRADAAARGVGDFLGNIRNINDDAEVAVALQNLPPEARKSALDVVLAQRKGMADVGKTQAETKAKSIDAQSKALRDISNVASQEAQNPNNLSLSRVRSVANFYGIDLPQPPTDPRDVNGVQSYLQTLANAGYDIKDRKSNEATIRGQDLTRQSAVEGQGVTMRGQDIGAQTARRGQDLLDTRARQLNSATEAALMAGEPKEITVDGKPVLAVYDKRSGTFFDANTRQPIGGGMAPKQDTPAAITQAMAQNEVTLAQIRRAKQLIADNPGALGLKNLAGDTIMQRVDPEGVDVRAIVGNIAGQKIHDRSGAAVTIGEMQRLKPYIPNVTDTPETVQKKLDLFDREYSQIQAELAQGRSLASMINERRTTGATTSWGEPSAKAAPAAAPKVGQTLDSLPDPKTMPGVTLRSPDGKRLKSDGTSWVPVP